jgi:hypothetical protein
MLRTKKQKENIMMTLGALLEVEKAMIAHADDYADEAQDEIENALGTFESEISQLRNYLAKVQTAGGTSTGTVEQLAALRNRLIEIASMAIGFAQFSQPRETS